jgi:hypothetical protein
VLVLAIVACGSPVDKAIGPLQTATLTPGVGLGPIRIGETTFASFIKTYGIGVMVNVQADEAAYEATFASGQLSVMFILDGECRTQTYRTRLEPAGRLEELFKRAPACRDITVSSVSVRGRGADGTGWWRGKTDKGVALGDSVSAAAVHGMVRNDPGRLVAGSRQIEPPERVEFVSGMYLFHAGGAARVIQKLTVFRPE